MADSVQALQRNLYQTKFAHLEYRDGRGVTYDEQLRALSWPVPDDVPQKAQPSATNTTMVSITAPSGISFMDTHAGYLANGPQGSAAMPVHDRLSMGSKSFSAQASSHAQSPAETQGDEAFAQGSMQEAIRHYTQAINTKPNCAVFEKRCAALAHVGKYEEALVDARRVLAAEPTKAKARLRVKDLTDYLDTKNNCTVGYNTAHVTLLCNLTPPSLKMWRSPQPSVYRG